MIDVIMGNNNQVKVDDIKTSEVLMLNVGTATTVGIVKSARKESADLTLRMPICADIDQRVAISRRVGSKFRLIGYGIIEAEE